jgi:hypothetical protein
MNVSVLQKKDYDNKWPRRAGGNRPKQSQTPAFGDSVQRVADSQQTIDNSKSQIVNQSGDLKKQSQFAAVRISAKSFIRKDYENKSRRGPRENKAKQSQFRRPASPKVAGSILCSAKTEGRLAFG